MVQQMEKNLFEAIKKGKVADVQKCLDLGADVNNPITTNVYHLEYFHLHCSNIFSHSSVLKIIAWWYSSPLCRKTRNG
jgi:hypothetical protein